MQSRIQRLCDLLRPWLVGIVFITAAPVTLAQDFVWAPEFPVGSELPDIEAADQNGEQQNFDSLVGENGLLFMLSRSFDW